MKVSIDKVKKKGVRLADQATWLAIRMCGGIRAKARADTREVMLDCVNLLARTYSKGGVREPNNATRSLNAVRSLSTQYVVAAK